MNKIGLLAIAWVVTFAGGHVLGAGTQVWDPYYYCAARNDTCSGSQWHYSNSFRAWCCCDFDQDQQWHLCWGDVEVYENEAHTLICYKLIGNMTDIAESCIPGPVAAEPIQEVINAGCGCKIAPQGAQANASVVSPN